MECRSSSQYGWLSISATEYARMVRHEYAGPGTPLHPDKPGHWAMVNEDGTTVLYTGVEVIPDSESELCTSRPHGSKITSRPAYMAYKTR